MVRHVGGIASRPHVRVVQRVVRAVAIPCVSIQSCRIKRLDGRLVWGDGDLGGIERDLFWRWRSDKRLGESELPRFFWEGGAGAMYVIHVRADPRNVGRGSGFVVEEGGLGEGETTRERRGFI